MDQLKIGDLVLSGDGSFSKVYSFAHKQPNTKIQYLHVLTASMDKNQPLEISAEHLIYVHKEASSAKKLVPAASLKVGQYLVAHDGSSSEIRSVKIRPSKGVYSPLTASGTLVVNGVVASNYVSPGWIVSKVSGETLHYLEHAGVLLYRLFCTMVNCEGETYDATHGLNMWVLFWFNLEQWQLHAGSVIQTAFLLAAAVPMFILVVLGKLLSTTVSTLVVHFATALVGYWLWKKVFLKKPLDLDELVTSSACKKH